mmetsp:Transcript_22137/g.44462  ORF Transcript_22137/g.44462 Transcript_22137/m.44462 type:complete len:221 (-) Transcript_22137:439-1101(-)
MARALRSIRSRRRLTSSLLNISPCRYNTSVSVPHKISSARCFLVMSCSIIRSNAWTCATSSLNIIDNASDKTTTAAPIRHGPPSTGRIKESNPPGARRIISNFRNRDKTASHSNFLSHNSRRERADAPAWAAAAAAAVVEEDGSLGLADVSKSPIPNSPSLKLSLTSLTCLLKFLTLNLASSNCRLILPTAATLEFKSAQCLIAICSIASSTKFCCRFIC